MTYLIFLSICFVTSASPGPAVLLALKNGARFGIRKALVGVAGNISAMITLASLSAAGLGAVIMASASLFTAIKLIGGGYLIYLGIKTWRSQGSISQAAETGSKETVSLFREAYMVGISNPKAVVFYTALFPQFIDLNRPVAPQFALLATTFAVCSFTCLSTYALLATRIRTHLGKAHISRWFQRITGGIFVGFGVGLLSHR